MNFEWKNCIIKERYGSSGQIIFWSDLMPFCKNCGRQLADNEICNCAANANAAPPTGTFNNVNVDPNQPQKKKSSVPIILIILIPIVIVVLLIGGILAAILVPAMLGYTKKSKTMTINYYASDMRKAFNCALETMDEQDYNINGYFIISSEKKGNLIFDTPTENYDLKSFDASVLESKAKSYTDLLDEYEWFVVIEDGMCKYAACSEKWHSNYTGSYPAGSVNYGPQFYNNGTSDKDADLQDLYDYAYKEIVAKSR